MTNDTTQFRRKLVKWDLERMNLPEEYWTVKVNGVAESVRSTVARYLTNIDDMMARGAGLLIMGPRGVGKTAIAGIIAKEARSRGYTVFYTRIWELREMLRSRIWFDDEGSISDRTREVAVLVLDDLREEDTTERFFPLSEIQELIRHRNSRHKITIVTTRLGVVKFRSQVLESFMAAIQGVLVVVQVAGPNFYERKQNELERAVFGD